MSPDLLARFEIRHTIGLSGCMLDFGKGLLFSLCDLYRACNSSSDISYLVFAEALFVPQFERMS